MILRVGGRAYAGAVVDLREASVDDGDVLAALRGEASPCGAACATPGEIHERVGHVHPGVTVQVRPTLAAAARSRDIRAPEDDELAAVREEIAAVEADLRDDSKTQRTAVQADSTDADRDRLRERVAELRGRVQTLEERGEPVEDERERLRETARRLSELETSHLAARQERALARRDRDRRERRMRLEDRAANLERQARASLVDAVREEYAAAVEQLAPDADPFDAEPVVAALAVLRVAEVRAPVVLAVDRFESPASAARWLGAPVVRL